MKTPILFIIFKRYDTAIKVFERIRTAKPEKLYIAADAPRDEVIGEREACLKTRSIVDMVDWPCEVHTLFQTQNQGCGIGPIKAISWFFSHEEMGIVLEDDCLPHLDFFPYCEDLLRKYKDDTRISLITGRNSIGTYNDEPSYFLSALHFCWGWASWRRVWKQYDYDLKNKTIREYYKHLRYYFGFWHWGVILWRLNIFMACKTTLPKDIWDYQFAISTQFNHSYTIVPKVNLVHNIGFGTFATHTSIGSDSLDTSAIYPLTYPSKLEYNKKYDIEYSHSRYKLSRVIISFLRSLIKYKRA